MKSKYLILTVILLWCGVVRADEYVRLSPQNIQPQPVAQKALLYVIRDSKDELPLKSWTFANKDFLGVIKGTGYFYTYLKPGKYLFWSRLKTVTAGYYDVKAGQTYYLKQDISTGFFGTDFTLIPIAKEKALDALKDLRMTEPTKLGWDVGGRRGTKFFKEAQTKAREDLSLK